MFSASYSTLRRTRATSITMLVGAVVFCLLVAIPLLLATMVPVLRFNLALIPVALVLLYSSIHLASIASSKTQQIVASSFWAFVYVFLGVCPLLQLLADTFPWPGSYDEQLLVRAGFMTLAGILTFDAGRVLYGSARGFGVPRLLQRPIRETTVLLVGGVSLLMALYFLQKLGGFDILFLTRLGRYELLSSQFELPVSLLLVNVTTTPTYVILVALLVVWVARRRMKRRVGAVWIAMTLVLMVATLVLNNPIGTPRFKVGTILLSLFFVLPWRRWSGAVTVAGLIFAVLVVFPFAALFRNSLDASLTKQVAATSAVGELTRSGDFDAYQMIANSASIVDKTGLQLGRQISGAFLFWVPRSLWAEKPIATGQWVAQQLGYQYTNLSSPLWAEFYVDGGWLLLCVGFLGYGYLVRTLDRWYEESNSANHPQLIAVVVPIYAGYQFFLLRGALMPAVAYFAPMLLCALICGVPRKGRSAYAPATRALN